MNREDAVEALEYAANEDSTHLEARLNAAVRVLKFIFERLDDQGTFRLKAES